jgi:hypothetical protein
MREEGLGDGERVERLQELFDDGWPDWSEDGGHGHEDGEGHDGHDHDGHNHGIKHHHH